MHFSSIAYANQEIYLALVLAGSLGLSQALPISLMITALLAIVALSYYQTIYGYPSGGGSYVVAGKTWALCPACWRPRRCWWTTCSPPRSA